VYDFANTFNWVYAVFFGMLEILGASLKGKSATPVGDDGGADTFYIFVISSSMLYGVLAENISTSSHDRAVHNLPSLI